MRWDSLFDDLESQLEHELDSADLDLLAEEERLRLGRLGLRDRLAAIIRDGAASGPLDLALIDGSRLRIAAGSSGKDWISGELVEAMPRRSGVIVPTASIAAVTLDGEQLAAGLRVEPAPPPAGRLSDRLGLPFVLRDLCRRRIPSDIVTPWARLHGTIDRVGRDHLDLAEHDPGVPRRDSAVQRIRMISLDAVLLLRF